MEYRNIGGRSNKKYYSNKSTNINKFVNNYTNDIDYLIGAIEDKARQIDKLKKDNDALSRKQMQILDDLEKQQDNLQKRLNRIGNKTKQSLTSTDVLTSSNESLFHDIQREHSKYKNLSTWYADKQETKLINRMNEARSQMTTQYINQHAYDSNGNYVKLSAEQTAKMNQEINKKLTEQFGKDIDKFGSKVSLFSVAADVINKGIEVLKKLGLEGINKQSAVYEKTFENISVRTGLTRSQYYDAQRGLQVQLSDRGLFNNVASSDVQQMWNTMATNGINLTNAGAANEAQLYARAIDMVVTSKIVPYLDMSSQSLNILDQRLNGKFIQDIRGINLANNQIAGNNYVTEELLKQIIDQVQPMSDEAIENLASSSTEVTALINQLAPIMGKDAATSYAKQWFKADKYSDQMLRSGTLTEKMSIATALVNDTNYHNPAQASKYMIESLQNDVWLTSLGQGYGSAMSGLITNTIGTATGNIERQRGLDTLLRSGKLPEIISNSRLSPEEYAEYVRQATNAFSNDQNQTNEQLQSITVENFMNRLAVVKEWLGNYTEILKVAIEGIGAIIIGKIASGVIGKGIGALAGMGGTPLNSAGGLGSLLGAAGPLALGITAVVGSLAIANAYAKKMASDRGKNANDNAGGYTNNYSGLDTKALKLSEEDVTSAGALEAYGNNFTRDEGTNKWKSVLIDNFGSNFVGGFVGLGNDIVGFNGKVGNPSEYNKAKWDDIINQTKGALAGDDGKWLTAAYAMAMLDAGNSSDIFKSVFGGANITSGGIKAFVHQQEAEHDFNYVIDKLSVAINRLAGWDLYPVGPDKHFSDLSWTDDDMKNWGVYRTGLSSVPYDNFPALLHENEAVLTASTANELRNLIVEYRNTNRQSINFETIIQHQTVSLISKINEVITAINNINTPTGTNRLSAVRDKLSNSMLTMTSTKSFT